MFTASGLRVRFLKVIVFHFRKKAFLLQEELGIDPGNFLQVWEKSGYNTVEWVRYITKAGSYEIRCQKHASTYQTTLVGRDCLPVIVVKPKGIIPRFALLTR